MGTSLAIWSAIRLVRKTATVDLEGNTYSVDPFLAAGLQAHGAQMSNGKDVIARISLDDIDSPYPYALMIPQSDTERIDNQRPVEVLENHRTAPTGGFERRGKLP